MIEDTQTIQNILKGDAESEKTLYDKYWTIISSYIKKNYSNHNEINDDISEILTKVFLNISKYDEKKSKFKSWVLSITKNHMIDKWREKRNDFVYQSITANLDEIAGYYNDNSNNYNMTDSLNKDFENSYDINQLRNQITYTDYSMLEMKYIQGYNYNEIGQIFNITSSTVSNKINYLKTKLKKKNYSYFYDKN